MVPTTVSMVGKHMGVRKEHPGLKNKENDENSGPTTTVFVGNISEKASDMLIRQLLAVSNVTVLELSPADRNSDILTLSVLLYLCTDLKCSIGQDLNLQFTAFHFHAEFFISSSYGSE